MMITPDEASIICNHVLQSYRQSLHAVPTNIREAMVSREYSALMNELTSRTLSSDPHNREIGIAELERILTKKIRRALAKPGECVGASTSHSLGEMQTQTMLNHFHKAGAQNQFLSSGVGQFQELLNCAKNPKIPNTCIFFTNDELRNPDHRIGNVRTLLNLHRGFILSELITNTSTLYTKPQDWWWWENYTDPRTGDTDDTDVKIIRFMLDIKLLFKYRIHPKCISQTLTNNITDDMGIVEIRFSHPHEGILDIHIASTDSVGSMNTEDHVGRIVDNLLNMHVVGIPGVSDIFLVKIKNERKPMRNIRYFKEEDLLEDNVSIMDEEWAGQLYGTPDFRLLLSRKDICARQSICNNIWTIFETLGVEGTRAYLIEEYVSIMSSINLCHIKLLVERMTLQGGIASISRYTLRRPDEGGGSVFQRSGFEETHDHFIKAGLFGEEDKIESAAASIICGRLVNIGTGMTHIKFKNTDLQ